MVKVRTNHKTCLEETRELIKSNQIEQPRRPEITHKRGGGRRKETLTESNLRKTAETLTLKKISYIFKLFQQGNTRNLARCRLLIALWCG